MKSIDAYLHGVPVRLVGPPPVARSLAAEPPRSRLRRSLLAVAAGLICAAGLGGQEPTARASRDSQVAPGDTGPARQSRVAGGGWLAGLQAEVFLHRSRLELELETKDGRTFPISVSPAAVVELRRPAASDSVAAAVRVALLDREGVTLRTEERREATLGPGLSVVELPLSDPSSDAVAARLRVESDEGAFERTVALAFRRVSGRVTDLEARPTEASAYVIFESDQNRFVEAVACDESGRFEIEVPERFYHTVWAVDEGFGHTTLERYAHRVPVDRNLELRFRIGQLELYRLSAAATAERTVLADFSVFTIAYFVDPLAAARRSGADVSLLEFIGDPAYYPPLEPGDVKLFIDDLPLETWSVSRRWSSMAGYGAPRARRPYWTVEAGLPGSLGPGRHVLRVVVTAVGPDGQTERGEASFHELVVW